MMKYIVQCTLLFGVLLLAACQNINSSRAELGIPPSVVIFSFDDGPNAQSATTGQLLDVLEKHRIQAMFFLLGENAEHNPELVNLIYAAGHYIANHGYSDKWASKMNDNEFRDNLVRGGAAIANALEQAGTADSPADGLPYRLYRPHGGFYRSKQETIIREEGYTVVPVTVRIYDAVMDGTKQQKAIKRIVKKIEQKNGGLVLLHDGRDSHSRMEQELSKNPHGVFDRSWIPAVVDAIIPQLLDKGFILHSRLP